MKKQFLFGMAAVAALCSCSNNEVLEAPESLKTPIAFGTYVGNSVDGRGAIIDKTGLQNGTNGDNYTVNKEFGVFAYYTPQTDWDTADDTAIPNFMYNQQVTYTTDWGYTPVKYWPNNNGDKISFFAYAPYVAHSTVTGATANTENITAFSANNAYNSPKVTYTLKTDDVKGQDDFLYADVDNASNTTLNRYKQTNVDAANISITDKVKFQFEHALARIGFNVETTADVVNSSTNGSQDNTTSENGTKAAETIVKVTKVELSGKFYSTGTFDIGVPAKWEATTLPVEASTFILNYVETQNDSYFDNTVATNVTTTKQQLNAKDSYIMVIPQNFDGTEGNGGKLTIKVIYDVYTQDNNLNASDANVVQMNGNIYSKITNTITSSAFTFNLEQSKAYMFNLHIGLTSVKFDADVTDWDEGTGTGQEGIVNVPINKN